MQSHPRQGMTRALTNGLVISVLALASSLSYAALIFSGLLAPGLGEGISAALIGSAVVSLVLAWRSAFPFAIAGIDAYHAAVLGGVAATMAASLQARGGVPTINALYLVVLSTFLTGVVLYGLGAARMGRWIRFVPYPVTGGVMVGVGWLMVAGGVQVFANLPLTFANLPELFTTPSLYKLAGGLAWAALLFVLLGRNAHYLTLPAALVGGSLVFLCVLAIAGIPFAQARAEGWLFDIPAKLAFWTPWSPAIFAQLDARSVISHFQELLTLTFVNALTVLVGATGLELETRRDIDLDEELRGHGVAQLASAAAGGFPGFLSISRTMLNYQLGSRTRTAGYVAALATLAYALIGPVLVSFIPKAVLGGLIIYLGGTLIWSWVWVARKRTTWSEYLAMLLIAMAVTVWGFVTGVVLGVMVACLMFVISYSRVGAVKHLLSGALYHSSRVRSSSHTAVLQEHGEEVRIFMLQGFLFFGSADRLYRQFGDVLQGASRPMRYAILDFRHVSGIDSSAVSSFRKIANLAQARGVRVVITALADGQERELGSIIDGASVLRDADLDAGLQWCETELLRIHGPDETMTLPGMRDWLTRELGDARAAEEFLRHVETRDVASGTYLCREGEAAESMFLIGEGMVEIERTGSDGKPQRLRTLGRHTMIGEMGLYRSETRSASVVARLDSQVYELTREALERMRATSPALAEALCVALIKTMAERLSYSNSLNLTLQG